MNLSALILAGGKSSRMGRDKAWLEIDGLPLIKRQIALVHQLGITEVFISGRADTDYSALGCTILRDTFLDAGPLAGIERGLEATTSSLLLVLAVDLPRMELGFLQNLSNACDRATGVVPLVRSRTEPLIAIYPKQSHKIAVQCLENGQYAVNQFVEVCRKEGMVHDYPVASVDEDLFLNWNAPEDLLRRKR
jgi:molybdopterin-guanine dinucleotide biosynthesis protein A